MLIFNKFFLKIYNSRNILTFFALICVLFFNPIFSQVLRLLAESQIFLCCKSSKNKKMLRYFMEIKYLNIFESKMVSMGGLEPPTSGLWILCSNQLSYTDRRVRLLYRILKIVNIFFDFLAKIFVLTILSKTWLIVKSFYNFSNRNSSLVIP